MSYSYRQYNHTFYQAIRMKSYATILQGQTQKEDFQFLELLSNLKSMQNADAWYKYTQKLKSQISILVSQKNDLTLKVNEKNWNSELETNFAEAKERIQNNHKQFKAFCTKQLQKYTQKQQTLVKEQDRKLRECKEECQRKVSVKAQQIIKLKAIISQKEILILQIQKRLETYQRMEKNKNSQVTSSQSQVSTLKQQLNELISHQSNHKQEIQKIKKDYEEKESISRKQYKELKDKYDPLFNENTANKQRLSATQRQLSTLKTEQENKNKQLAICQKDIGEIVTLLSNTENIQRQESNKMIISYKELIKQKQFKLAQKIALVKYYLPKLCLNVSTYWKTVVAERQNQIKLGNDQAAKAKTLLSNKIGQIGSLTVKLNELNNNLAASKETVQSITQQLKQTNEKLKISVNNYSELSTKCTLLQTEIKKVQTASKQLQDKIKFNQLKTTQLINQELANKKKIQQITQSMMVKQKQMERKDIEIQKMKDQIRMKNREISQKTNEIQEKGSEIMKKDGQIKQKTNTISLSEKAIAKLKSEIEVLKGNVNQLNGTIQQITNRSRLRQNTKQQKIDQLTYQLNKTIQKCKQSQFYLKRINEDLITEISWKLTGKSKKIYFDDFQRELTDISNCILSSYNQAKYFNGSEIIPAERIDFLLDTFTGFKFKFTETKLLYRYDPLNKQNFHKYLDGKPNIMVVIKISNGTIIGGFSAYPLDPVNVQKPGQGFIFNLNREKFYKIRADPRMPVISYDNYYFILGNAQIRIKSQQKKVFSNFGIANSTFNNEGDQRTKFLNVNDNGNNELDIDNYEFYQLKQA